MSEQETQDIETYIAETERRLLARFGKWALAHMVAVAVITASAVTAWSDLRNRQASTENQVHQRENYLDNVGAQNQAMAISVARIETEVLNLRADVADLKQMYRPRGNQ